MSGRRVLVHSAEADGDAGGTEAQDRSSTPSNPQQADEAFTLAYLEHRTSMVWLVTGLLSRGEAEEVVQDVFLSYWQNPHQWKPERGSLRTLLMMRTKSRAIDIVRSDDRRWRRERAVDALRPLPVEPDHDGTRLGIRDALAALPADERRVLVHVFYGDQTYRQAAASLGLPEGTVKARIRRGLARLRENLLEDSDLDGTEAE